MRDYQTKSNKGGLPDSITTGQLGAGETNALLTENKIAVSSSGQTLAPADGTGESTDQLARALAIYGAGGAGYCIDTGSADAYVLNPVSPKKSIPAYFDGMRLMFKPGNVNTGASTVNYASLGVKSVTYADGTALSGGEIGRSPFCELIFNSSSNRFEMKGADKFSYAANGYYIFENGFILQWGEASTASGIGALITFPITFPNAVLAALTGDIASSSTALRQIAISTSDFTTSGMRLISSDANQTYWAALGY